MKMLILIINYKNINAFKCFDNDQIMISNEIYLKALSELQHQYLIQIMFW